jgi:hypothetical protein
MPDPSVTERIRSIFLHAEPRVTLGGAARLLGRSGDELVAAIDNGVIAYEYRERLAAAIPGFAEAIAWSLIKEAEPDCYIDVQRGRRRFTRRARRRGEQEGCMNLNDQFELVLGELAEFYSPEEAKLWLFSPHKLLGGETAAARIEAGRAHDVLALLDQLRSGAYV